MCDVLNKAVLVETKYGKIYSWQDDMITRQLVRFSAHTRNEIAMLADFLRPGDFAIDVGAHIGTFTLPFALFTGTEGLVLSVEGSSQNFALLQNNVKINSHKNVILKNMVVSDGHNTFVMRKPNQGNTGAYQFLKNSGEPDNESLASSTLDQIVEDEFTSRRIDLIKIDVEGSEMDVLNGSSEILEKQSPALYIEINKEVLSERGVDFTELLGVLTGQGYLLYRNIGHRNSSIDRYQVEEVTSFDDLPPLFDVLAVNPKRTELSDRISKMRTRA
jgi:FkbM family methyltransferase